VTGVQTCALPIFAQIADPEGAPRLEAEADKFELSDHTAPGWQDDVRRACGTIEPGDVLVFLQTVQHLLRDPAPLAIQKFLLREFVGLLGRGRDFAVAFAKADLAPAVQALPGHWIDVYESLIKNCPDALQRHVQILRQLTACRPRHMFRCFSSYLDRKPILDGSFPLIEVLQGFRKPSVKEAGRRLMLSMLNFIFKNKTPYVESWRPHLLSTFVDYLESTDRIVVSMAYYGIMTFHIPVSDTGIVAKHLQDAMLWKHAVVFLSATDWSVTESLIAGLSCRSADSQLALRILLRRQNEPEALELIAAHRRWLYAAKNWPIETFQLLTVCLGNYQNQFLADPMFGFCLRAAAETSNMGVLGDIAAILAICHFNAPSLALLAQSGFLRQYQAKTIELRLIGDLANAVNTLAVVDYNEDFMEILQALLSELNLPVMSVVLRAILTLCRHRRCANQLRKIQFHVYCQELRKHGHWADLANGILQAIKHAASRVASESATHSTLPTV
jgi:hypothetical protein